MKVRDALFLFTHFHDFLPFASGKCMYIHIYINIHAFRNSEEEKGVMTHDGVACLVIKIKNSMHVLPTVNVSHERRLREGVKLSDPYK